MSIKIRQIKAPIILNLILLLISVTLPIKDVDSRKLDETTNNGNEKCAPCGGNTPSPPPIIYPSPPPPILYPSPPPPILYPSPPPPLIYLSPPPPSPNKPPSVYYPPPPSPKKPPSGYYPPPSPSYNIYNTGPPGNLYPIVENFNRARPRHHFSLLLFLPLLLALLVIGM
ncbi:extensin-1-like [Abrus precatorius]|uniref:Extensin-1-like n=1 Tax=Abrus precatorius TaxID=3816 RepID=A0A8B8M0F1_ABRPR|nr:extensin-1-like [Abrus precatorius]